MRAPRQILSALLVAAGATGAGAQVPLPQPGAAYSERSAVLGQDVVVSVSEINELAMSSAAVTLSIGAALPGETTATAQNSATTYGITTNGVAKKITAALSLPYADGVTLGVELAAPPGATATARVLGTTALDVMTGLARIASPDLSVTYTATAAAGAQPTSATGGETRTVTLTLTDG